MKNTLFDKDDVSIKRELNSDQARSGKIAINWLNYSPIYISTKTTGTDQFAEVIEIAILDSDQSVLFHSQIKPSVSIDEDLIKEHGINLSSLQDRPSWSLIVGKIKSLIENRHIIMFDVLFETRIIKQSCSAYNLDLNWVDELKIDCAMHLAVNSYGSDNRYGTVSIDYAMKKASVIGYKGDTGAVSATYALVQLIKTIAAYTQLLQDRVENKNIEMVS